MAGRLTALEADPAAERPASTPTHQASGEPAVVRPAACLRGELALPGDKSVSHRALILAALAEGESRISGAGDGADVRSTARIVAGLGTTVERVPGSDGNVAYRVLSPGAGGLREPDGVLDCGNSGTSLRLLAGVLAGLPMTTILDGDSSLRRRPVARIIEPLRSMGATLHARRGDSLPPVTIVGRHPLRAVDVVTPVPSAQVKSAILLAALRAAGTTSVTESVATRDHTERMLRVRGVRVHRADTEEGGVTVSLEGGQHVQPIDERVPGDVSAAMFWLVAGSIHPDAELLIRGVGVNPTRRGGIDLLRRMGADIHEQPLPIVAGAAPDGADTPLADVAGEPMADLTVRSSALRGIDIGPREVAAAIDELPILCLAATRAAGRTTIRGAGELRHKESDRIGGIAAGLRALGGRIDVDGDDITIDGASSLSGAATDSLGDHRLAMTFAVAGLIAGGETSIAAASSAAVSYPSFLGDLERIRA